MNEINVTKYDMWRHRRCKETIKNHYDSCVKRKSCAGCDFDITIDKFQYLSLYKIIYE